MILGLLSSCLFVYTAVSSKEHKQGLQCAQKGGMLVLVICGFIKNFVPNSYFILQIYHAKNYKIRYDMSLYFQISVRYS